LRKPSAKSGNQDLRARSKFTGSRALPVLVVRAGGSQPHLDDCCHNRSLFFSVEDPTLGLSRAKTNDPTCHVLPGFSLEVPVGRNRFGILQRSNRFPQGSHSDAVTIPYGRTKVPP
jgi:hypothetical protein